MIDKAVDYIPRSMLPPEKGDENVFDDRRFAEQFLSVADTGENNKNAPNETILETQGAKPELLRVIFRISALSLSLASSALSAWFSFGALARNLPLPVAVFLSAAIVLSGTLAPELIILLWRRKRYVMPFLVGFVGVVSSAYSMGTTIIGQYNARTFEAVQSMEVEQNGQDRERILAEIDRLNISIDTYQTRITRATNDGKTDSNATALKKQDEARKAEYEKQLAGSGLSKKASVRKDFYAFASTVLGIPAESLEFYLSVLPALLLDIAAPVFAVVFMLL